MSDDCGLGEGTHWICECQQKRMASLETENARLQAKVERLAYERVKTGHRGDAVFCRHCGYGYVEPDQPCHEPGCIVTEVTDDNEA